MRLFNLFHFYKLFPQVIVKFKVFCSNVISSDSRAITGVSVTPYFFALTIDIKAFAGVEIVVVALVQVDHRISKSSLRTLRFRLFSWYSRS